MKKILLITLVLISIGIGAFAQVPQLFKYQAVARDNAGNELANTALIVRVSIHDGTATGTVVYSESHNATTNQFGLFSINIGSGTVISGTFGSIDWSTGNKYLQQEINFGSGFQSMGTSELLSVPYALYSVNGVPGPQGAQGPQGPQGADGSTGATGVTGATGPQGPAGPAGATGSQGPQGAQGAQGPQGPAGAAGAQGLQGVAGAQGRSGEPGLSDRGHPSQVDQAQAGAS